MAYADEVSLHAPTRTSCSLSMTRQKIAYYLWRYPLLSETFVQREITALQKAGVPVMVVADRSGELAGLDENAQSLARNTTYLMPMNVARLGRALASFSVARLAECAQFILSQRYQQQKSYRNDLKVFLKAAYLAGVLRDARVDHAHCPWSDVNALVLRVASRLAGISYSLEARAHDLHRRSSAFAMREKFRDAAFIITNCRYNEQHLRTLLAPSDWSKIHVIYEGLNLGQFQPRPTRDRGPEGARLLTVARLIEQKGLLCLLKACKSLKDKGVPFRCEIVGGPEVPLYGAYHARIKAVHAELGLHDRVSFLGPQPFLQVLEAYKNADVFILPSTIAEDGSRDVTPNVLMEAMAMGLPVITTSLSGIPEIVDHKQSGILIAPNDEHALAQAIVELIGDEELQQRLAANARRKVEEKFDISANILAYAGLFRAGAR